MGGGGAGGEDAGGASDWKSRCVAFYLYRSVITSVPSLSQTTIRSQGILQKPWPLSGLPLGIIWWENS